MTFQMIDAQEGPAKRDREAFGRAVSNEKCRQEARAACCNQLEGVPGLWLCASLR